MYQFVPTRLIFSFIYYLKLCISFENDEWILWGKKSSENLHFSFLHRLTCFQCTTRIEFMRNLMHHIKRFTSPKWSHNMELINASKNHSIIFGERYISLIPRLNWLIRISSSGIEIQIEPSIKLRLVTRYSNIYFFEWFWLIIMFQGSLYSP